jgi:small subunit ribosomal protein S1
MPYGYLDSREEPLKSKRKEDWAGISIPARIHELDQSKNKIILNHKVIADEHREARAKEVLNSIAIGQTLECTVVRTADFGVFVDIGGIDALIPSSELSWTRFKKPSDVVKVGDKLSAKVFKIETEAKRVALSVKQANPDPWTVLPEEIKAGYQTKAQVITQAEFGVFVEIKPGIEALLHRSNFMTETTPEIGSILDLEVINLDQSKKRMGVKVIASQVATEAKKEETDLPTTTASVSDQETTEEKEAEYV